MASFHGTSVQAGQAAGVKPKGTREAAQLLHDHSAGAIFALRARPPAVGPSPVNVFRCRPSNVFEFPFYTRALLFDLPALFDAPISYLRAGALHRGRRAGAAQRPNHK